MHERPIQHVPEEGDIPKVETIKIAHGLAFGNGTISAAELWAEAGDTLTTNAETIIYSPYIITPLSRDKHGNVIDDDGCGDGRRVKRIFHGLTEKFKRKSFNRAKVFGGGTAMATAAEVGLGKASSRSLQDVFGAVIETLDSKKLNFGAHTADHVADSRSDSGCGAIDGAPKIIQAVNRYETGIVSSIEALGLDIDELGPVLANFQAYGKEIDRQPYSGKAVIDKIMQTGKVVKELAGKHREAFIVLNKVRGHTVDQPLVRRATKGKLDVFAVDVWRMEDYANKLYDNPAEQCRAFLSMLVYTLATAGVLTKGDLPVYIVDSDPAFSTSSQA